jgi:class 3 adenylate cyclase/tetratricopeptide (TPR) repeat protein
MIDLEHLASYVPRCVLRSLGRKESGSLPREDSFRAAVLFADISGFTDLSDRFGRKGPEGTEELMSIVNSHFRAMLGPIGRYGGDVLKMAGDALVVAWECPDSGSLREPVLKALQCAHEIQEGHPESPDGLRLSVRIGVGVGVAQLFYVGGVQDHWEVWPVGDPFRQMGVAEGQAKPGEVVVSPETWEVIGDGVAGSPVGDGCVRVEKTDQPLSTASPVALDLANVDRRIVEAFVPKPIRFLLNGAGESWVADLRPVTSLFVHVPDTSREAPTLARLQDLAVAMQKSIYRFEGTISGSGVDEKGLSLMITFGLPPMSHEDDPFRATQTAMAIRSTLADAKLEAGIGLATGRAFCGAIGSPQRREYAVLGRTVNLAARLASHSAGEVLCDEATFQPAAARLQFTAAAPLRLKGIPKPIPIFTPTGLATQTGGASKMIGHQVEFARVASAIDGLKAGEAFVGIVEGEAGIGKSTLIHQWSRTAANAGVRVLRGGAESIHGTTPYYVWRGLLGALLGVSEDASLERRRAQLLEASQGRKWEQRAPLFNDILDLGLEDNAITSQIDGKIRADNTRELIATVIGEAAADQPLAIVLEDCHWMDSASVAVASVVAQRVHPMILLVSSRILTGEREHLLAPLLALPGIQRLRLEPLRRDDCVALVAQRLCVRHLAKPVADLVAAKSQGNPFFSVEIAFALREHGFVIIEGDECKPVPGLDLSTVKFPDNVQGIIMRRVDGLDPAVQLTAKVASVIGCSFSAPLLRNSFPTEAVEPKVEANLEVLQAERLVTHGIDPDYMFSHAIVEEAIYDRLLGAQRKALHERVALGIEKENATAVETAAPLLGHHWLRAGDEKKAGHYFGLAGLRAVRSGAYQEGLNFLTRAIELTKSGGQEQDETLRDGRWQILRAEALFGLGQIEESWKAFREAAKILGWPVSEHPKPSQLLRQISQRLLRGISGARLCKESDCDRVRLLACCYEMLSLLDLFSNRMTSSLSAALESLSQAEQLGDSAEYARALATMALATSLVPANFLADRYARAALKVAARLGQDSTTARVQEFAGMYLLGEARWQEAEESFDKAIAGFQVVGDRRRETECTCLLSTWNHYRGDFVKRVKLGQRVFELAIAAGDLQAQAWGLLDQIESLLNLGDFERVHALGADLRRHLGQNIYGADEIMAYGLLAALELRTGRLAEAMPYADKALAVMTAVTPTIVYNLEAYAAVADVYIKAWRITPEGNSARADYISKARQACECARRFAKIFRIGDARALLLNAAERELSGDTRKAVRLSRDALAAAIQLQMPYEEALAHRQLARLLPEGDRSRQGELVKARDLFSRLAAKYDLGATEAITAGAA